MAQDDGWYPGMLAAQDQYNPEEGAFQHGVRETPWFKEFEQREGAPNLNDPNYDYRAAWAAGARPDVRDPTDGTYHWPSAYKGENHPNRYVDGVDTITGKPQMGSLAAPAEPSAFEAAASRLRAPYARAQAAAQERPTRLNTLAQGAVESIKTPASLMAPNPYPEGSEEWQWYENNKSDVATTWAPGMALNTMGTGAVAGVPAGGATLGAGAVRTRAPKMGELAATDSYPPPTGSKNPLDNVPVTFRGKEPAQFTPDEWQAFGQHHGAEDIGPLSPLQTFKDVNGKEFQVPGGTDGKWTYYDTLFMKANPINPAEVDRGLHTQLQQKLGRTMTPEKADDATTWNGLIFGMTSPNNPLFPNQATASRMRLRDPQMLDDLASMIPWKPGENPTPQARKIVNDAIANRFGLDAASKGGLGTRGTADYSRVGEMAQMFKQDPQFFRKRDDESWTQAVERISSQLPGLSMKTGSFGTVWQNPATAAISAIDRHMARELDKRGGIFASPAERKAWEDRSLALWNARESKNPTPDLAKDYDDMLSKRGSDGHVGELLLDHVGKALTPKFRMAKGEVNPNIPEHLANAKWVREPETVFKVGQAYKQALDVNQKIADEHGLNLFMSQWMEWDRIRNRFEPHENMFPGLSKLPAMSIDQMRAVDLAHKQTGHKTYTKTDEGTLPPTRPFSGSPSAMGYLGLGGAAVVPWNGLLPPDERQVQ